MLPDNPFFTREIRQLLHRPRPARLWSTGAVLGTALYLLLLLRIGPPPYRSIVWIPELMLVLVPWHAVMCVQAGLYGANRIFADEHRRATLEGLFLLPAAPGRWLLAKLVFPVSLVLLAWAAGLPFYVGMAALGMASASAVHQLAFPALLAGLGALPVLMLLPPDYRERLQRLEVQTGGPAPRLDGDLQSRLLLLTLAMLTAAWLISRPIFVQAAKPGLLPLFHAWVPEGWIWLAATLPFVIAAGLTALATASREERAERFALWARAVATACFYFLLLGGFWKPLPLWTRVLFVILPLGMLFALARKGGQREDAHAAREIDWIMARWDNPLLIRDLRVYSRLSSIRRGLLTRGLPVALLLVAQAVGISWAFSGAFYGKIHPVAWALGGVLCLPVVLLPAVQASQSWLKERRAETLQMLLLTPQRPAEMVRARLLAGTVYYGLVYAPVLFVLLAAPFSHEAWQFGPMLLAFAPQWYAGILAVETAERPESPAAPGTEVTVGSLLLIGGSLACIFIAFYLGVSLAPELEPWRVWMYAALLAAAGVVIGWLSARLRTQQLRSLQEGGLEEALQGRGGTSTPAPQELLAQTRL